MLSRKEQNNSSKTIDAKWSDELIELLRSSYQNQCDQLSKDFKVYGFLYPDEILLIVSLVDPKNPHQLPVTIFISGDLNPDQNSKKLLYTLVDFTGIFFDDYFATSDWNHWQSFWQEEKIKNITIYYKITRENVDLTLMADELLAKGQKA